MTEHYVGIDIHKTESQVAVLDELGEPVEEVRVFDANLDEIVEKYAGSKATIEAGSNYFTIYDRLDEHLDVTLANPPSPDWLENQKQKDDRKDAKALFSGRSLAPYTFLTLSRDSSVSIETDTN